MHSVPKIFTMYFSTCYLFINLSQCISFENEKFEVRYSAINVHARKIFIPHEIRQWEFVTNSYQRRFSYCFFQTQLIIVCFFVLLICLGNVVTMDKEGDILWLSYTLYKIKENLGKYLYHANESHKLLKYNIIVW